MFGFEQNREIFPLYSNHFCYVKLLTNAPHTHLKEHDSCKCDVLLRMGCASMFDNSCAPSVCAPILGMGLCHVPVFICCSFKKGYQQYVQKNKD